MARRLSFLLIALAILTSLPGVAAAADGAVIEGVSTFYVRADAGVVHASIDVAITNGVPDAPPRQDLGSVTIHLLTQARNVVATSAGARLSVTIAPVNGLVSTATIRFPLVAPNQTRRITITYDIVGAPPGSDNPIRIHPGHSTFPVFGVGDQWHGTIKVVVPARDRTEVVGSGFTTSRNGDTNVVTIPLPDADIVGALVTTSDDAALTSIDADVGSRDIRVLGWPDDRVWQQFATSVLRDDLPALEDLIGQPWPLERPLTVRESMKPRLAGVDATFDEETNTIEIGDELDEHALVHQLAHAWINDELFESRWIREGLAIELANRTLAARGRPVAEPVAPAADAQGFNLDEWHDFGRSDLERNASDTSTWLMKQLIDEIGIDATRRVIDAAAQRTSAYGSTGPNSPPFASEQMLDLFEVVGGSKKAAALFATYVFSDDEPLFQQRANARTRYDALIAASDGWKIPPAIRDEMSRWHYQSAVEQMDVALELLRARDTIAELTAQFGLSPSSYLRTRYEGSPDKLQLLSEVALRERAAAQRIVDAGARLDKGRGLLDRVGLLGASPDAKLEHAKSAFRDGNLDAADAALITLDRELDDAGSIGFKRLLAVLAVLAGAAAMTRVVHRIRRRQHHADSERERMALRILERTAGTWPNDRDR